MFNAAKFDALTSADLAGVTGVKWDTYPNAIGAFIAEMDFETAPVVQDALRKTVDAGYFGYLSRQNEERLQRATANWYDRNTEWNVQPEMVHSMPDVLKGLEITLNFYAPKGGRVIVPTPSYMPFLMVPKTCKRDLVQVPMLETDNGWEYDYGAIDQAFADGGEVLIVCNPYNPIGRVLRRDEMERLCEIVDRHDGRVFSDEIHAPLVFAGQQHLPYASINETAAGHTITAFAASKAWNTAGLKCAQIIISNDDDAATWNEGPMWTAHGASVMGVIASVAAYDDGEDWLSGVIEYLDGNRKRLAELVEEHLSGVRYRIPEGTYLAWLDFSDTSVPDDIDTFFLENAKVAIVNGAACGDVGKRHVRFNFAMSRCLMEEAIAAMGKAMKNSVPTPV